MKPGFVRVRGCDATRCWGHGLDLDHNDLGAYQFLHGRPDDVDMRPIAWPAGEDPPFVDEAH